MSNIANGLLEIFSSKIWSISPEYVAGIRQGFQSNLLARNEIDVKEKNYGFFCTASSGFKERLYITEDPEWAIEYTNRITPEDQFINVVNISGPITRNGYGCSYGSKHHRDQLIFASKQENCIGTIILMDSPGGSAFSRHDYAAGIKAVKDAGQQVIGLVDGMCLSACQAVAVMCDKVFYRSEKDTFGCIGTMAAFYTTANGSHNVYDDTTYHELYDPESFEKNGEVRKLVEEGDDSLILAELAEEGKAFRELVQSLRPSVSEEHLHGKVFDATDVVGILNDGQGDFDSCVKMLTDNVAQSGEQSNNSNNQNEKEMKNYKHINEVLEVESLPVTGDGSFYCNGPLAEKIEARLEEAARNEELLQSHMESVEELNSKVKELQQAIASGEATAEEYAKLSESYKELESALAAAEEAHKSLETKIEELNAVIAEKDETIKAKDAEIDELSNSSVESPTPEGNDGEGKEKETLTPKNIYTSGMSPREMAEAQKKRIMSLSR